MSRLSLRQIKENDIDWFCEWDGLPIHIASMGGYIPMKFRERHELRPLEELVNKLPYIAEVKLNRPFIHEQTSIGYGYLDNDELSGMVERMYRECPSFNFVQGISLKEKMFAHTFIEKARKGFLSYARSGGNTYIPVAIPITILNWKEKKLPLIPLDNIQEDRSSLDRIVIPWR